MKMAINELNSLCRSALEGSGWAQGDYEDAADAAVWLQAMRFDGIEAVMQLLGVARVERYSLEPALRGARARRAKQATSTTGLAGCVLSFELAWARSTHTGAATVSITNALSPRLALYGLKSMCGRGRRFDLSWTDGSRRHFATTAGNEEYPDYLGFVECTEATVPQIVVCCRANDEISRVWPATDQPLAGAIDPLELDGRYRDALWRGIEVDALHIDRLIGWKSNVLVAATQASRSHGAGGADDGF